MTDLRAIPMAELVPHSGPMCLLDRALSADGDSLSAELTICSDSLFAQDGQVGGWVGIEYMAQAIAAWAGWQARERGEAPKLGFLLGSRRYDCSRASFHLGELLRIHVRCQFHADNGLGQFDCRIEIGTDTVASAALTVFEPANADEFFKEMKHG